MLNILSAFSLFITSKQLVKENREKKNPNTHVITDWDAYKQDVLSGVSHEQRMKKMQADVYEKADHPEPDRDKDGKIIIENCELFESDKASYGITQAYKWAAQGKYNLTPKELEIEQKRIEDKYNKLYELARRKAGESYAERHKRIQSAMDDDMKNEN